MISDKNLINIQKKIGYKFKNIKILSQSLTHPSFLKDESKIKNEFERFEFLGDRVLGLMIASLLYAKYKNLNEEDHYT